MKRLVFLALLISAQWLGIAECTAAPTTFPTGVTIHNREKAFVGLTMFNFMAENRIFLIDMEGNIVNTWVSPNGGRFGPLAKPMPDGKLMALFGTHNDRGIGIFDWDGNLLWEFFRDGWNLNHDFVYGAPYFGADILPNQNVLILAKIESNYPNIASYTILDDNIVELSPDGNTVWSWSTSEHFDQLMVSQAGREEILSGTNRYGNKQDVYHTNSIDLLPGNRFGRVDPRFKKGNLMVSERNTNKVFIIDRSSGNIVWLLDECLGGSDKTVGQHHVSMIPAWLPGAGDILLYDNGGMAGYPERDRFFSRVREINPVTCDIVWEYDGTSSGLRQNAFFSRTRGSAQRLPNGNTLISEAAWLRIFEVTVDGEIVWEYVHPDGEYSATNPQQTHLYRAYRLNPGWPDTEKYPEPAGKRFFPW